jgi:hypothetical protein
MFPTLWLPNGRGLTLYDVHRGLSGNYVDRYSDCGIIMQRGETATASRNGL